VCHETFINAAMYLKGPLMSNLKALQSLWALTILLGRVALIESSATSAPAASRSLNNVLFNSVAFSVIVKNSGNGISRSFDAIEKYARELNEQGFASIVFVYGGDSTDDTMKVISERVSQAREHDKVHEVIVLDPLSVSELMPYWPITNGTRCGYTIRNCRLAAIREGVRQKMKLEMRNLGLSAERSLVITMDGDIWKFPSTKSITEAVIQITHNRLDGVFANGRSSGCSDNFYYDSFATVSLNGTFEMPKPSEGAKKYIQVQSGFGGLGMYSGEAYWLDGCSYRVNEDFEYFQAFVKNDKYAKVEQVYGWPCEHVTLNTCIARSGKRLAIHGSMKVERSECVSFLDSLGFWPLLCFLILLPAMALRYFGKKWRWDFRCWDWCCRGNDCDDCENQQEWRCYQWRWVKHCCGRPESKAGDSDCEGGYPTKYTVTRAEDSEDEEVHMQLGVEMSLEELSSNSLRPPRFATEEDSPHSRGIRLCSRDDDSPPRIHLGESYTGAYTGTGTGAEVYTGTVTNVDHS